MTTINTLPILIGHNDTLLSLYLKERGEGRSFFERSDKGHIDLPRAREGGFGGGFFAVFVPSERPAGASGPQTPIASATFPPESPPVEQTRALGIATAMTALLFRLEDQANGQVKVVRTADELAGSLRSNVLAAILHFEGAEAIDTDLDALEVFYRAGLRSLGLVWSRP